MQDINLKDKIFMENENIKVCNIFDKKIKEYFKKYLNEKVVKIDNSLIKKIHDDLEFKNIVNEKNYNVTPLKNGHSQLHIYVSYHYTSLTATIKICFNGGTYEDKTYYCVYIERTVYIGKIEQGILKEIEPIQQFKLIDYEEQKKLINTVIEKSRELKTIRDKIHYSLKEFFKYDLVKEWLKNVSYFKI